jgi:hypothetical protein
VNIRQERWKVWTALAAACLFLLQSTAGASAFATGPRAPVIDAFGNPLCITSGEHTNGGGDQHQMPPQCCGPGCTASSAMPGAPPAEPSHALASPAHVVAVFHRFDVPRPNARSGWPGNPRGPPLAA